MAAVVKSGSVTATAGGVALDSDLTDPGDLAIQCDPDSSEDVYVGDNSAQEFRMQAGDVIVLDDVRAAYVYVRSAGGAGTVRYLVTVDA